MSCALDFPLTILQALDKDRAESLLRDNAEVRAQLDKYPMGPGSLAANAADVGIINDDRLPELMQQSNDLNDLDKLESHIKQEMRTDPARALADTLKLPLGSPRFFSPKLSLLWWIAVDNTKSNPAISKAALDEFPKLQDQLSGYQLLSFPALPEIYLQLGDEQGATKAVRATLKVARKLYEWDTDSDHPNQAFKAMWPSTLEWADVMNAAEKITPDLMQEVLTDIPDTEISAVVMIQRGSMLLGRRLHLSGAVCHRDLPPISFSQ